MIDGKEFARLVEEHMNNEGKEKGGGMSVARAMPRDPVCGRRMNRNKAYAVVRYGGVDYLLCCTRYQAEFEADPERYLADRDKK